MTDDGNKEHAPIYQWPWWLAGFLLLGLILTIFWMRGAVAEVERIRKATDEMKQPAEPAKPKQ